MAVEQAPQRRGADQRVIGIEDRDVSVTEMLDCLQRRMGGAQTLLLHNTNVWFGFFPNRIHIGSQDNNNAVEDRLTAGEQVAQHGSAGEAMEGFRHGRFHARAKASGEDNGGCLHALALFVWGLIHSKALGCAPTTEDPQWMA